MKTFILALLILVIIGCNQNDNSAVEPQIESSKSINEVEKEETDDVIVLNNGEKWKVVDSMLVFIRNMELSINQFDGQNYTQLATDIDKNIRELTSNCTMKGQAHDELHKWLVPFIGLSEDLDVAEDSTEQKKLYMEFKSSFEVFNTYFE